ncbi:MAG: hypothetical protein N3G21_12655 [Candidatus Hydrogenedentes bacterium]|nr:hypothetical protein [Candidatus Hydrogenedentota bacterium]
MQRISNVGLGRSGKYEAIAVLCKDVEDLKGRISRLEQSLMRGLWLLTANLLGVIFSLVQQILVNR